MSQHDIEPPAPTTIKGEDFVQCAVDSNIPSGNYRSNECPLMPSEPLRRAESAVTLQSLASELTETGSYNLNSDSLHSSDLAGADHELKCCQLEDSDLFARSHGPNCDKTVSGSESLCLDPECVDILCFEEISRILKLCYFFRQWKLRVHIFRCSELCVKKYESSDILAKPGTADRRLSKSKIADTPSAYYARKKKLTGAEGLRTRLSEVLSGHESFALFLQRLMQCVPAFGACSYFQMLWKHLFILT